MTMKHVLANRDLKLYQFLEGEFLLHPKLGFVDMFRGGYTQKNQLSNSKTYHPEKIFHILKLMFFLKWIH